VNELGEIRRGLVIDDWIHLQSPEFQSMLDALIEEWRAQREEQKNGSQKRS
jgi:hypothetical protein